MISSSTMAAKNARGAVLILDDDLGFAMWLGRALHEAGLAAFPATTVQEALAIAANIAPGKIHGVVANLALVGARELIEQLAARNKLLKVVAIGAPAGYRADARINRPRGKTRPPARRYVEKLVRVLGSGS